MQNVILIYGLIKELIDKHLENIKTNLKIDDINIIKYDYDNNLYDIIEDANMPSLFKGNKLIIVYNSTFLKEEKQDNNLNIIENYLKSPNKDTYLVFILEEEKLDTRRKIVKLFNEKAKVYECTKLDNQTTSTYIQNYLTTKNYKIDISTINILINRLGNNISSIKNELDKIIINKKNSSTITKEDINYIKETNADATIFTLIEAICNKETEKSIKLYRKFIYESVEPVKIIALLASKYRLIYQVKILYQEGKNKYDISKILKVHSYPVSLAITLSYKYSEKELLKILSELYYIDLDFKKGKINIENALELFILKRSK